VAEFSDISDNTNGKYHKPQRELAKREIHRLITSEGLTNAQLCQRLNLPRRTLERYLHEIFSEDCEVLIRPTAEAIATETAKFQQQLMERRQAVLKIADDTSQPGEVRLQAEELAINMAFANLKLLALPPAFLERTMRRPEGITRAQEPVAIKALTTEATNLIAVKKEKEDREHNQQ